MARIRGMYQKTVDTLVYPENPTINGRKTTKAAQLICRLYTEQIPIPDSYYSDR